ncbi:MAG: phosphodiester glycosidase family protein [Dehalococcoidia bacterium]
MLRRIGLRRVGITQPVVAPASPPDYNDAAESIEPGEEPPTRWFRRVRWKRAILVAFCVLGLSAGAAYSQKDRIAPTVADFSRRVIGDENTARVEGFMFNLEDKVAKAKYKLLGGEDDPFARKELQVQFLPQHPGRELIYYAGYGGADGGEPVFQAEDLYVPSLDFPATTILQSEAAPGEGKWATAGLPRNTPGESIMAKTFIRPDKSRPYAQVGVLLVDSKQTHLSMVGGTAEPGGDRGVKGPGVIPKEDYENLLIAFNGGFKGPHGGFGMVANGKTYMPMRDGLATICTSSDGTILLGQYGRDFSWQDDFEACRQNAVLLVDGGEVSRRTTEGNDTWGYVNVNSSEFITWRSAVGITREGDLLIAAGNSLSADTLAKALWASGAYMAMQLDINGPYISTGLFYQQPDGTLKAEKFMDGMAPSASNFLGTRERDFFYVTVDE